MKSFCKRLLTKTYAPAEWWVVFIAAATAAGGLIVLKLNGWWPS